MSSQVLSSQMLLWLCLALSEVMNCFQNREWERINYTLLNKNIIKNNSLHFSYYCAFLLSGGTMIFQGYHEFKITSPLALWNRLKVHYPPLFLKEETEAWRGPRACTGSHREPGSLSPCQLELSPQNVLPLPAGRALPIRVVSFSQALPHGTDTLKASPVDKPWGHR